jgi:hypothetical protein
MIDECRHDGPARHRCVGDGDLTTRQAHCTTAAAVRRTLDGADALGIDDAASVVKEANRQLEQAEPDDVISRIDRDFLKGHE